MTTIWSSQLCVITEISKEFSWTGGAPRISFTRMNLRGSTSTLYNLKAFKRLPVGFSGEQVQMKGYITLRTTFRVGEQAKEIKVKYLVIDVHFPIT